MLLPLTSCSGDPESTTSGTDTTSGTPTDSGQHSSIDADSEVDPGTIPFDGDYQKYFNDVKTAVTTNHNYKLEISSYLTLHPTEVYTDTFVNINDKILYGNYLSSGSIQGIVYQKNQGYINFFYAGNNIIDNGFYSTNPNAGISSLNDLVAENLFLGAYTQDSTDLTKFTTSDTDTIAVASNFTGYNTSSWFVAPEQLIAKADPENNQIVFTVNFDVYYIEEGQEVVEPGVSTLKLRFIGSAHHQVLESYVENPTNTFTAPTKWSDSDKALLDSLFAGKYPSFPSGASYAFSTEQYNDSGTYKILLNDYDSGDLTTSYGNTLVNVDGFTNKGSGVFERVEVDTVSMTKTTYTIQMVFVAPTTAYYSHTVGYYYPKGIFQALFKAVTVADSIDTVAKLNEYYVANGYDEAVPTFSIGGTYTVANFIDKTTVMNSQYGAGTFIFYSDTSYTKIYIASYEDAQVFVNSYVTALTGYGFDDAEPTMFGNYINYTNDTDFKTDSYVSITDLSKYSKSEYEATGYIQIRYQIYAFKPEVLPNLVSITLEGSPKVYFELNEAFSFGANIYATYTASPFYAKVDEANLVFSGYNMAQSGTQTVTVSYTFNGVTKSKTYEIYVASTNIYKETFRASGEDMVVALNLSDDGTGTYSFTRPSEGTYKIKISYVISGSTITFTLQSMIEDYSTSFSKWSLFGDGSLVVGECTATGSIEGNTITLTLSKYDGTNPNGPHNLVKQ